MKPKYKQSGITLIEVTVVIVAAALLMSLGLTALRAFLNSFESGGSVTGMISSALASARTIALKNQRYAGIRFQKAYHPEGPLKAPQYMIFIIQDPDMMAYGFSAVPGLKPIRLPETIGVMDLRRRTNINPMYAGDEPIDDDGKIDQPAELQDTTSFSIIFSPSGKLVIHDVRVRNRQGIYRPANPAESADDVFNSQENVASHNVGMFIQDDYAELGLGKEASRSSFIVYQEQNFKRAYARGRAWSEYLVKLLPEAIYINPYTGTIINK